MVKKRNKVFNLGYKAAIREAGSIINKYESYYQKDIFPEEGVLSDSISARAIRHECKMIRADLYKLYDGEK